MCAFDADTFLTRTLESMIKKRVKPKTNNKNKNARKQVHVLHCNRFIQYEFIIFCTLGVWWWLFNCKTCSLAAAHGLIYRSISFYYSCHFCSSFTSSSSSTVQRHYNFAAFALSHSLVSTCIYFINFCICYDFFVRLANYNRFSSFIISPLMCL